MVREDKNKGNGVGEKARECVSLLSSPKPLRLAVLCAYPIFLAVPQLRVLIVQ